MAKRPRAPPQLAAAHELAQLAAIAEQRAGFLKVPVGSMTGGRQRSPTQTLYSTYHRRQTEVPYSTLYSTKLI